MRSEKEGVLICELEDKADKDVVKEEDQETDAKRHDRSTLGPGQRGQS